MSAYFDPSAQPDGDVKRLVRELRTAFDRVRKGAQDAEARLTAAIEAVSGGGGAPDDAEYLLCTADGALANARVLTAGSNITFDDSVAGVRTVNAAGGGIAGIDVEDTDESPTVATVTQLRFDSADGFVVSSPGAGIARVDLASNSVPGDRLADDGVTFAKLQNIATNTLLGRESGGSGNVEELTLDDPFVLNGLELRFNDWGPASWYANPTGSDAAPVEVTPGTGLQWNGTTLEVDAPNIDGTLVANVASVLHRETAALDVTNTNAATAVLSYNMPAGTLVAGRTLRIRVFGHYRNTDNGNIRGQTYAFNFGGVTLWTDGPINITGATAFINRIILLEFELYAETTTLHYMTGRLSISSSNLASTGFGDIQSLNGTFTPVAGIDSTVDISSASRLVEVTVQHSATLTSLHWVRRGAYVERI